MNLSKSRGLLNDFKKYLKEIENILSKRTTKNMSNIWGTLDYVIENLKNIKTKGEFTLIIAGRIRENNKTLMTMIP